MVEVIAGVKIPDSAMCIKATALVRETENDLLYHHSRRVFIFGALVGQQKKLKFEDELLYIGAMFHDMGLTKKFSSAEERFEVDGANAAADFLREHKIQDADIEMVWDSIALHTTPGIPKFKKPVVALVTSGVEMDVLGMGFAGVEDSKRAAVVEAHPRGEHFKQAILKAFNDGIKHKPDTTFGNVKADVLAHFDPQFKRTNFCDVILNSGWSA
jgi:HD superfamily phosphodiesterase